MCKTDEPITTGKRLRSALTCPRPVDARYDAAACVKNQCSECKDGALLNSFMCADAQARAKEVQIKVEKYEKRCKGQDPETKEDIYKHDFFEVEESGAQLLDDIKATLLTFNPHHDLACWQDQDWQHLKCEFPRGSFVSVQDFAENIHHIVRMEPQSKYWTIVSSTLYMVVLRFHLDDVNHIPPEEKAELHAAFAAAGLPPIIVETHAFVSPDTVHDSAFVRHINDAFIIPYVNSIGNFHTHYARSDGCKGQFKQAQIFKWVTESVDRNGIRLDWSFFCSCHGKCDCDGEGGSIKNAIDNYENHGAQNGLHVVHKLPDAVSVVQWGNHGSPADSPHGAHAGLARPPGKLTAKLKRGKSNSIYRRIFHLVPNDGPNRVPRKTAPEVKLEGSASRHSFVCTSELGHDKKGHIQWRERSCHQCEGCWKGLPTSKGGCPNVERCGKSSQQELKVGSLPTTSLARALRTGDAIPLDKMLTELELNQMVVVFIKGNEHEPWMLARLCEAGAVAARAADVTEAKELGFTIKPGAQVLRLQKFEPFEAGSRKFAECKVNLVVPTCALRRHKLINNAEKQVRKSARLQNNARYGEATFELKEEDHRAIVGIMQTEGIGEFTIESIVGHRVVVKRGKPCDEFHVKWKGWERNDDRTWEPLATFKDAELIATAKRLAEATRLGTEEAKATVAEVKAAAEAKAADETTAVKAGDPVTFTSFNGACEPATVVCVGGLEITIKLSDGREVGTVSSRLSPREADTEMAEVKVETEVEADMDMEVEMEAATATVSEGGTESATETATEMATEMVTEMATEPEAETTTTRESETPAEQETEMETDTTKDLTVPERNDQCFICQDAVGSADGMVAELQCGHALCYGCLMTLLSKRHKCCSICRLRVSHTTENHRPSRSERRQRFKGAVDNARQPFVTLIYPAENAPLRYGSLEQMLGLVGLRVLKVCGDGNCGYYSCLTSCNRKALDHPTSGRNPTIRDYEKQAKLRVACVDWLLKPDQLPFCKKECGFLVKHETVIHECTEDFCMNGKCYLSGMEVSRACEPLQRDDNAIKRHLKGKCSPHGPMGVYANGALLRAMAATKQVYLVCIDTSSLCDLCTVYPPGHAPGEGTKATVRWSWAEEIVPKVMRQRSGELTGPPLVVIVWNGDTGPGGHFDATCKIE